jgi:hypothetical protein
MHDLIIDRHPNKKITPKAKVHILNWGPEEAGK